MERPKPHQRLVTEDCGVYRILEPSKLSTTGPHWQPSIGQSYSREEMATKIAMRFSNPMSHPVEFLAAEHVRKRLGSEYVRAIC